MPLELAEVEEGVALLAVLLLALVLVLLWVPLVLAVELFVVVELEVVSVVPETLVGEVDWNPPLMSG